MSSKVRILPPLVAERIAAGEVIERPASVVKELVENSLDAGATEIAVILEEGGKSLIEVLDNGHGMDRADLELCVRRHATSKLSALEDLEKIRTLGFRGEALPSVAAVAELSLLSRSKEAGENGAAHELRVNDPAGGADRSEPVTFGHFLGSAHGTRIRARGLFSQIPARLKFLKSQGSEVSQVREWLERLALTNPKAGFRLVSDDRTVLNLRPAKEIERVNAVLGDGEDYPVVTHEDVGAAAGAKLGIRIHWLQGLSSPQTRRLVQVVNGRAVRDRLLQQALLKPFRQALLPGQFPALALFLEVDPGALDVNVHPTKTELRFLDSSRVFRAVESAVERMIAEHGAPAYAHSSDFALSPLVQATPFAGAMAPAQQPAWNFSRSNPFIARDSQLPEDRMPDETAQSLPSHPFAGGTYAGTLFNTYFLYDLGHELALVDQHAAHERVRYEKLRRKLTHADGQSAPSPQQLLLPEVTHFPSDSRARLEERLPHLTPLGFEAELFGDDAVLFRAVPAEWGTDELRPRLKNLVEKLIASEETKNLLLDETLFEALASQACHSSVRAGDRLEREEAEALVQSLFACEHPWNCPHGRPTVARVPRARFEEWFQRRVPQ